MEVVWVPEVPKWMDWLWGSTRSVHCKVHESPYKYVAFGMKVDRVHYPGIYYIYISQKTLDIYDFTFFVEYLEKYLTSSGAVGDIK